MFTFGVPCASEVRSFALTCYVQDMRSGIATSCPARAWQPVRLKSGPAALQAGHCRGPARGRAGEETTIRDWKISTLHVTSRYSRLASLSRAFFRSPAFEHLYRVASCSCFCASIGGSYAPSRGTLWHVRKTVCQEAQGHQTRALSSRGQALASCADDLRGPLLHVSASLVVPCPAGPSMPKL